MYRRSWLPLFLILSGGLPLCGPVLAHIGQEQRPVGQFDSIERILSDFEVTLATDVAVDGTGGVSAGVIREGELIWSRAFGWADVAKQTPMTVHTIGRTGSISKSFAAVLMMQLAEARLLKLDDPVKNYLPEILELAGPPENLTPVTFRDLASHTAGLIREPALTGAAEGPIAYWEDKILASIPTTRFQSKPGESYSYSNIGFGILGLALSRAAGRPFMNLMRDYIFTPLQMEDTSFSVDVTSWPRLSAGYQVRPAGGIDPEQPALEHKGRGYKVPNGGIYSTVPDLARFVAALTATSRISLMLGENLAQLFTVQTPESETNGYGLGFSIERSGKGRTFVSHGGSVAGYNAFLCIDLQSKMGVVLLRNYTRGRGQLKQRGQKLLDQLTQ